MRACYVVCQGSNPDVKSIFRPPYSASEIRIFTTQVTQVELTVYRTCVCLDSFDKTALMEGRLATEAEPPR